MGMRACACVCLCNVYRTLLHLRSDEVERPNWCHSDCVHNKWPHFFTHSIRVACCYHLPKSKQKNHPFRKFTSKLWASSKSYRISWIVSQPVSHHTNTIHFINLKHFPGRDTSIIIYWLFLFGLLSFWVFCPFFGSFQHTHTDINIFYVHPFLALWHHSINSDTVNCFISLKYMTKNDHIKWYNATKPST